MGTIVSTMNHYPRNGWEGDPEFSARYVYNPGTQDSFLCDTSTNWIVSHINKPYISTQETGLDWITFSTSHQVGWIE